ncbi:MAG: glycoside hydrolase family 97 protein [Anaerolineales bacterium]|nr:glycoside hydrolase family 97 protein [Anaerolineales bacterium]
MKLYLLLGCVLALTVFLLVACAQQSEPVDLVQASPSPEPEPTATLTPAPPELTVAPTATLNSIAAALATQAAAQAEQQVARPTAVPMPADSLHLASPDGKNVLSFALIDGVPYYSLEREGRAVIWPSKMGFTFLLQPSLKDGFSILDWKQSSYDQTWTQPWGEVKEIRDHHNQLRVRLRDNQPEPRELVIVFRLFDDGLGFRYEFPEQPYLNDFLIMAEETEFVMPDDHTAWWIPAYLDNRYEYLYHETRLSAIPRTVTKAVHTPITLRTAQGLSLSIHEAALVDYASMTLKVDENLVLHADLVPWSDGVRVRGSTPLKTPWRTIQVAEQPGDLITSYLILNLNEPSVLTDTSWIQPGKYIGIWWGMHLGKWTWSQGPDHGATTANTQAYLDFAAQNGFRGVLVEGWNLGWDGDWTIGGDQFNFTEPYPDFDLPGLAAYAAERGVKLIGHHETGAAVANYEAQIEAAFALYQSLGIDTVKTGYVGYGQGIRRFDAAGKFAGLEWHHGQYMVEHYQRVIETAARYGIMINAHEPIKDTGLRRTYPNFMTREGARGQEYNAWDGQGGNPPDHVVILPFTRLLSGPMDYTPGVLALTYPEYRPNNQVNHTLAKELALYVVIYSPLQMAADLIENYVDNPAFQFIRDVPADWQETRILHAEIGAYLTTVRQERDGEEWFLGSITNEEPRSLTAALDFLTPGMTYVAEIYADGPQAHWQDHPYALVIERALVDSTTVLALELAPGGGQAIRFYPAAVEEMNTLSWYQP